MIPTTGAASISVTTSYRASAYPLETVFPSSACPVNQAKMQIKWQYDLFDVYDAARRIGPRYLTDFALRSPLSPSGPVNCYGDDLSNFQDLGCDFSRFKCSYQLTTTSRCRNLTSDGESFNLCSNAQAADRIADMSGNFAYPTRLNALHTFFVNSYSCPVNRANDLQCVLITQNGLPDQISSSIRTSQVSCLFPLLSCSANFLKSKDLNNAATRKTDLCFEFASTTLICLLSCDESICNSV